MEAIYCSGVLGDRQVWDIVHQLGTERALESLQLVSSELEDDHAVQLADALERRHADPRQSPLRRFWLLDQTALTGRGTGALAAAALQSPGLRELVVDLRRLGRDDGWRLGEAAETGGDLPPLQLCELRIDPEAHDLGLAFAVEQLLVRGCQRLVVDCRDPDYVRLAERPAPPPRLMEAIRSASLKWECDGDRLWQLSLRGVALGDRGVRELCRMRPVRRGLRVLDLSGNEIGDCGAEAFAASVDRGLWPVLQQVSLRSNRVRSVVDVAAACERRRVAADLGDNPRLH